MQYDDAYRREETCDRCMCFEPLQGWRHVQVTERRIAQDFACDMQELMDVYFPAATVLSVA